MEKAKYSSKVTKRGVDYNLRLKHMLEDVWDLLIPEGDGDYATHDNIPSVNQKVDLARAR